MARDKYHYHFKEALEKDGWTITHDPLELTYGTSKIEVDLGAEKLIAAEKEGKKIAVEVKSFTTPSKVYAFHQALGQFIIYKLALEYNEQESRELYLAVASDVYNSFLIDQQMVKDSVSKMGLKLLIVKVPEKQIELWIN